MPASPLQLIFKILQIDLREMSNFGDPDRLLSETGDRGEGSPQAAI
jgi:hypothetical protein